MPIPKSEARPFVMLDIRDFTTKIKGTPKKPLTTICRVERKIWEFEKKIAKEEKDFCGHLFRG